MLLLIGVMLLCLYRIEPQLSGFNGDYLSKGSTNSIKGIFILLIVISHSLGYIQSGSYRFSSIGDDILLWIIGHLGQLVVVMFLFYSGYGIGESYKRKGQDYVNGFPRRRILTTLLNFDVAIVAFLLLGLLLGTPLTARQVLLSFVGWESVGNSNWYIFVIVLCYLFSYLSMRLSSYLPVGRERLMVILQFLLCFVAIVCLSQEKEKWWYNTMMCYPMGFLYSVYKAPIETFLSKHYWSSCVLLLMLLLGLLLCPADRFCLSYNGLSIVFAMLVVMLTMKVRIGNPALRWVGEHLFPIYIYMRLPMIVLENKLPVMIDAWPALFIVISLVVTLVIAHFYRYWQIKAIDL